MSFIDYFLDPLLRAPTWGTLFMCIASSLMGVLLFLKKRTLLAESLSHATYPGVVLGISFFALFFPEREEWVFIAVLLGALFSSFLAFKAIEALERWAKVPADAALCLILALFFGVGILAASAMQMSFPTWHRQIQMLLFGQTATMGDLHIAIYGCLAASISLFLFLVFRPLQTYLFDAPFASALGLRVSLLERILFWLLLLSLIVGIRSVGVVLISGMIIAPAVAARQFTDRLPLLFALAALFGAFSGLLGNILSVEGSLLLSTPDKKMSLPTGPTILLVSAAFALLSLAFAPKRGWLFRLFRIVSFRLRRLEENILKEIWKTGAISFQNLRAKHQISSFSLWLALCRLARHGWAIREGRSYRLTADGEQKAAFIVRLHRLWELYLSETLGFTAEKVHRTAEEMEHVLTSDLEERLTHLLSHPKQDPHRQPIPEKPFL